MLEFNILFKVLFFIIYVIIALKLYYKKAKFEKYIIYAVLVAYIAVLINTVFFPIPIQSDMIQFLKGTKNKSFNLVPLLPMLRYTNIQIIGNFVLLMPLAFLMPFINYKYISFRKNISLCTITSFCIEITQLLVSLTYGFAYKICDINDFILNVFGALIGYIFFKILLHIFKKDNHLFCESPQHDFQ
ncbi:VanZ family protein [Thermoanaerobacterium thermosaccharolyticum]|uniref:VanZ family protein n=1 Tax=Thermoanaerobacterium thermosaccharolyticum TaxID=1517 RepID=UPI003D29C45B